MSLTEAPVPSRTRMLLARITARRLALLGLVAGFGCKDAARPPAAEGEAEWEDVPSTLAAGAPATYTDDFAAGARLAEAGNAIRIYKNHDAWRGRSDGGRDEMSLVKLGKAKGADFFVHPISSLAAGIPAGTRLVIIAANSKGDAATSEAQRSVAAQQALVAFLRGGGTLLVDLADNESGEGYRVPGATGTPSFSVPSECGDATLAPAAFGADGLAATTDDHRFVRGQDGLSGTADDIDDETMDLAHGGSAGGDRSASSRRGCAVAHGNLEDGLTLPSNARVLATANWAGGARAILAEYCHMGGRVIVNTFTLGYFGLKPREGAVEPIRSTYIQRSLFAYALSAESYCFPPPSITAPADVQVATNRGACVATSVNLGTPHVVHFANLVGVERRRSDGQSLTAPYPKGVTTVTWTVTDVEGGTATATQSVSVRDLEKPALKAPAGKTASTEPGLPTAAVDVGAASATDNCGTAVAVTAKRSDGAATLDAPYFAGSTKITWSAKDEAGNEALAEQTVVVNDVEAPAVSVPANFAADATSPGGAAVQYASSARDNVAVTSFVCDRMSGSLFPIGSNETSCMAADRAGNSTTRTFTVKVNGAAEQIASLISYVRGVLPTSAYQTQLLDMLRKVQGGMGDTAAACADLAAFAAGVSAHSGTLVPADKAKRIVADAERIRSVLGCAP